MPKKSIEMNSPQFWAMVRRILASGDSVEIKPGPKQSIKVIHKRRGTVIVDSKIEEITCP